MAVLSARKIHLRTGSPSCHTLRKMNLTMANKRKEQSRTTNEPSREHLLPHVLDLDLFLSTVSRFLLFIKSPGVSSKMLLSRLPQPLSTKNPSTSVLLFVDVPMIFVVVVHIICIIRFFGILLALGDNLLGLS